jgi:hypothetical protein
MRPLRLEISIVTAQRTAVPAQTVEAAPSERVVAVVQRLLVRLGSDSWPGEWSLLYQGVRLPLDGTIGALLPAGVAVVQLVLSSETCELPALPSEPDPDDSGLDLAFEDADLGEDDENEHADFGTMDTRPAPPPAPPPPPPVPAPTTRPSPDEPTTESSAAPGPGRPASAPAYHATVRYYSRMNPQRVYPLLVMLTSDMIERIQKPGTDQRVSGPFHADQVQVVEVEPILPGCQCYPARQTTRLTRNATLRFHVVPNVIGPVTGAAVFIRQDHRDLASVNLTARVVRRTSAMVCAILAVLVPLTASLLRHADVQFGPSEAGGFNIVVELLSIVFGLSPAALLIVLGGLTGVLFVATSPRAGDVFLEIKAVTPGDWLQSIVARKDDDPGGSTADLRDLVTAHPEHQAAWLEYADWCYETRDYEAAREGYEKALALGPAQASDYVRAALAASRLGRTRQALDILQTAEPKVAPGATGAILFFNMGCYHARLGQFDQVVPCLRRAVSAGYRKLDSFLEDDDLAPVRGRADFQELVQELRGNKPGS